MKIRRQLLPKFTPRITAFLLFFSMLLPIFTLFPSYAVGEISEQVTTELAPIETEEQVFARLTANSQILNYVDEAAFRAAGHANRLPAEEDLNSYVFENEDGTRTAYILAEPVKYIDNTGTAIEKNLSLSSSSIVANAALARAVNTSAYTVTATDTPMTFPADLSQGVRFTYKNYTVTLRPEIIRENTLFLQADGKAMYHNAFGSTAHLVYTPTNTGMKEDILLVRKSNVNTFSFILNTDGLIPAEDAGGWYLWDGISNTRQLRLGQVISYDANGDFSIGEMTVTPNGGTTYRITLAVDPTFLEDATYPVTVDPTLTVNDHTTGIIDAPVFEGIPNYNFGTFQYNNVGNAGGSYGKAMTAIKIPGLYNSVTFNTMHDFQLYSAKLRIKEASGTSSQTVNLYPIIATTAWTETSVKWNTLANGYDTNYNCSSTLASNSTTNFDITDLVSKWKSNTYDAEAGFVLTVNNATVNKQFHSCESTNVSARPCVEVIYGYGIASPNVFSVAINETKEIPITLNPESYSINFTSSDTSIARIDTEGNVVVVSLGETTINASITFTDDQSTTTASIRVVVIPIKEDMYFLQNKSTVYIEPTDTESPFYNRITEKFLEIENTTENAPVVQKYWGGDISQRWNFHYSISGGYYTIESVAVPGHYLGVSSNTGTAQILSTHPENAQWFIEMTESGAYKLQPVSKEGTAFVLTVGESLNTNEFTDEVKQGLYVNDTDFIDEWIMQPVYVELPVRENNSNSCNNCNECNNCMLKYNPNIWNNAIYPVSAITHDYILDYYHNSVSICESTNCYAYVLNNQTCYIIEKENSIYIMLLQPGMLDINSNKTLSIDFDGGNVIELVMQDATVAGFSIRKVDRNYICQEGAYKVALVIDNTPFENELEKGKDYHWYRQNPDGTWSHKPGKTSVICTDALGEVITDPLIAARNYSLNNATGAEYSSFIGYFEVFPMNILYFDAEE